MSARTPPRCILSGQSYQPHSSALDGSVTISAGISPKILLVRAHSFGCLWKASGVALGMSSQPSNGWGVWCRYGYARMYSGVSLDTFQKKMTVQSLTEEGLRNVGPAVAHMAAVEGLDAHRRAVTMRLGLPN